MAKIIVCDGCDTEIELDALHKVRLQFSDEFIPTKEWDMCADCTEIARAHWKPSLWPRKLRTKID